MRRSRSVSTEYATGIAAMVRSPYAKYSAPQTNPAGITRMEATVNWTLRCRASSSSPGEYESRSSHLRDAIAGFTIAPKSSATLRFVRAVFPATFFANATSTSDVSKGAGHERDTSSGRHPEGGVRPDGGRNAAALGHQRPPLRRVGNLPPQGIARGSRSDLCVAVFQLVRAADPAFLGRRQDVGAGGQQVRVQRCSRHPPVVRRHPAPLG